MRGRNRNTVCLLGAVAMLGFTGCFGKGVTPNVRDGGAADRAPSDVRERADSENSSGGQGGTAISRASSTAPETGGTVANTGGGTTRMGSGGFSTIGDAGTGALASGGTNLIGGSTGEWMPTGGSSSVADKGGTPAVGSNGQTTTAGSNGGRTMAGGNGGTTTGSTGPTAGASGAGPDAGNVDVRSDGATDAPVTLGVPGAKCVVGGDCAAGYCVDGVCCDKPCSGCNACVKAMTGKDDGTCAPVTNGNDPHDSCTDESTAKPCGNDGTCDGKGACRKAGEGQKCGTASCSADGNTFTPEPKCDGKGTCAAGTPQNCAPYQCTITGCARNCTKQSDCDTGTYCNTTAGTCAAQKTNGTAASQTYECQSGFIADGVCCNTMCGECTSCSTGTCTPIKGGTVCGGGGKVCVSGTCQAGCWIAGQFSSSGATNSSNACQSCQPTTSTSGWSTKGDGTNCATGKTCSSGTCQCTTGTDCGASGCINVNGNDNNHCGSCTNVCSAGKSCSSGACACTKGASACGGCLAWDFEWGSDPAPWVRELPSHYTDPNGATNLAITSAERHGGSSALVAAVSIGTADRKVALVAAATSCSTNLAGYSMSAWVFLAGPALTNWNSAIFIQTWGPSGAGDRNGQYFGDIPTGRWFEITIPLASPTPVNRIGIELVPNADWVGTMYIDDVVLTGL